MDAAMIRFFGSAILGGALLAAGVNWATTITIEVPGVNPDAISVTVNGGGSGTPPGEPPPVQPPAPEPPPPTQPPAPDPVKPPQPDPVDPPPVEPPPSAYTRLGPVPTASTRYTETELIRIKSQAEMWERIWSLCGEIGTWHRELVAAYDPLNPNKVFAWNFKGNAGEPCTRIAVIPGDDGQWPKLGNIVGAKRIWIDAGIDGHAVIQKIIPPRGTDFVVTHGVHFKNWGVGHALITTGSSPNAMVEIIGGSASGGDGNHAIYIDAAAWSHVENFACYDYGKQHCLRTIAAAGNILNSTFSNVGLDGQPIPGRRRGQNPLEFYVNGSHRVEGNTIRCWYPSEGYDCVRYRARPTIFGINRYPDPADPSRFLPLVPYTDTWNDPATWTFPRNVSTFSGNTIECTGARCFGIQLSSTYPYMGTSYRDRLRTHWLQFPATAEGCDLMLEHADQTWRDVVGLMSPAYRQRNCERQGAAMTSTAPIPVPEGWEQKAEIHISSNTTANTIRLIAPYGGNGWCLGPVGNDCSNQVDYAWPVLVEDGAPPVVDPEPPQPDPVPTPDPEPPAPVEPEPPVVEPPRPVPTPVGTWVENLTALRDSLDVNELLTMPGPGPAGVLLPRDGTPPYQAIPDSCRMLKCNREAVSIVDWVGWALDQRAGKARLLAMGGHADNGTNTVYEFDFGTLKWSREHDGHPPAAASARLADFPVNEAGRKLCPELVDGPMGTHSYDGISATPYGDVIMRVTGYQPYSANCSRPDMHKIEPGRPAMWVYQGAGNWQPIMLDNATFPRSAYDPVTDLVYMAAQAWILPDGTKTGDVMAILDPSDWSVVRHWGLGFLGKGGAMALDANSRVLAMSARGNGLRTWRVDSFGRLTTAHPTQPPWHYALGVGVTGSLVVGWDGRNGITTFNVDTGELTEKQAAGDIVPLLRDRLGNPDRAEQRVYGSWDCFDAVPGLCAGISQADVMVFYRAY